MSQGSWAERPDEEILAMIQTGETGWETMVPTKVAALIKEKCLFGYPMERMEFEY